MELTEFGHDVIGCSVTGTGLQWSKIKCTLEELIVFSHEMQEINPVLVVVSVQLTEFRATFSIDHFTLIG